MVEFSHSAGLKLNNERLLTAAADGVSKQLASITEKYDGSTMAGLDSLIPGPDKFKGTARKPPARSIDPQLNCGLMGQQPPRWVIWGSCREIGRTARA